jgi:hypothetical protein
MTVERPNGGIIPCCGETADLIAAQKELKKVRIPHMDLHNAKFRISRRCILSEE